MTKSLVAWAAWLLTVAAAMLMLVSAVLALTGWRSFDVSRYMLGFLLWGISGAVGVFPFAYGVWLRSKTGRSTIFLEVGLAIFLLGLAVMLVFTSAWVVRERGMQMQVQNQLHQLTEAMRQYADKHEARLPPAALRDQKGKPLLSWRVSLLPYLEESDLYERFRLDEPWDSQHNIGLLDEMPAFYRPVHPAKCPPGTTRYQVLIGPGTPFEIVEGPRLKEDFPDTLPNTILVVEAREPVPWTKPADLPYDPEEPLPELGWRGAPRRHTPFGRNCRWFSALCADGSVRSLRFDPERSERILRQVIVRNDGKGWEDE